MSKIVTVTLTIVYSYLLVQYLRVTLRGRNKDVIEFNYVFRPPGTFLKILKQLKSMGRNRTKQIMIYKKEERLPTDLKFILKWSESFSHYDPSMFRNGQEAFIDNGCTYQNCFLTNSKSLLIDPSYYDAILFDAEMNWDPYPSIRSVRQNYIFTASESASNYPVCLALFDSFYNLTWTYRVDSDIRWSYITILDHQGQIVGPKIDMNWVNPMEPTSQNVIRRLVHKRRAAAWFVSDCNAPSRREVVAKKLIDELAKYKLTVDTYGWCGRTACPTERIEECMEHLEQDYYFYLSFENFLSEDYVTQKLLYPLMHFTVPIVYGGANYSRFMPPGSYINAMELNVTDVAILMDKAIKTPEVYYDYFRWHKYYEYKEKSNPDICELCRILNTKKDNQVIHNLRKWWNPNYEEACKQQHYTHTDD